MGFQCGLNVVVEAPILFLGLLGEPREELFFKSESGLFFHDNLNLNSLELKEWQQMETTFSAL